MDEPPRFVWTADGMVRGRRHGWVLASDYDRLRAECDALRAERDLAYERAAKVCDEIAWTREGSRYFEPEVDLTEAALRIRALAAPRKEGERA